MARCTMLAALSYGAVDGSLLAPVQIHGDIDGLGGALRESRFVDTIPADSSDARLLSLLYAQHPRNARTRTRSAPTFVVRGPLYATQPELNGEPTASRAGIVSTEGLRVDVVADLVEAATDSEPRHVRYMHVPATGPRRRSYRLPNALEIRSFALPGRDHGVVAALYDSRHNTHRWIFESRVAFLALQVRFVGVARGYAIAHFTGCHPSRGPIEGCAGIVLVRIRDGAVFAVEVPDVFEGGGLVVGRSDDEPRAHCEHEATAEFEDDQHVASGTVARELERARTERLYGTERFPEIVANAQRYFASRCSTVETQPAVTVRRDEIVVTYGRERAISLPAISACLEHQDGCSDPETETN